MNIKLVIGLAAVTVVLASGCSSKPKKPPVGSGQTGSMSGEHSHGGVTHSHRGLPGHSHGGGKGNGSGAASGGRAGGGSAGNGSNRLGGTGKGGSGSNKGWGGGSGNGGKYSGSGTGNGQGGGFGSGAGYGGNQKDSYSPADLRDSRSILAQRIIYFNYNQANIDPKYRPVLDAHAALLRDFPNLNIRLEGHADERGSREYNVALSERRAASVRDYMRIKGVRQNQADVVGYGEEIPATFGHGEGARGK